MRMRAEAFSLCLSLRLTLPHTATLRPSSSSPSIILDARRRAIEQQPQAAQVLAVRVGLHGQEVQAAVVFCVCVCCVGGGARVLSVVCV